MRKACVGRQSCVSLATRDSEGRLTPGPSLGEISCQMEPLEGLQASTLPRLIHIQIVAGGPGEYDVVYSLPKEGRYKMWIRVHGVDVQDSPFQVELEVKQFLPSPENCFSGDLSP